MKFKKTNNKYLFLGISLLVLASFLPKIGLAALVPCGPGVGAPGDAGYDNTLEGVPCKLCHIFVLIDNIVKFILQRAVPIIATLMIIMSGIMLFGSAGDPSKIQKAKSLLTSVAIGLLIMYGAYLVISIILTAVGVATWTGLTTWFQYPCP